ncbi:MAG: DNA mismatch repair endonuclease MutL [Phototrophicales bacterium]
MTIQMLSDQLISQIAAGEVVERPASVVKELLENALDAGASNIHILVNSGGRKLISVSDDGAGIAAHEVELAFTRHATSKLQSIDDLMRIMTLGFRGEALSSIAAVSQVQVITRARGEDVGTQMKIDGGCVKQHQPVGAPVGTVIRVENLFFNTPARLKFLKSENTEKKQITTLVTRYAMAYPSVRFVLEQDGREVFRSNGTGQLADVLIKILGLNHFRQMIDVFAEDRALEGRPAVRVSGFCSLPEFHRADRTNITLFVNGRWIQDTKLTYAVIQAYRGMLNEGRFPVAVLLIDIAPEEVDVNVHPTKAEVRFRDPQAVFSVVQRGVREALVKTTIPSQDFNSQTHFVFSQHSSDFSSKLIDNTPLPYVTDTQDQELEDLSYIPEGLGAPQKPRTLPPLRLVGQIGATYIIAEGPAGMYLIDQHAAHQRILYEQYMADYLNQTISQQALSSAQTLEVTAKQLKQLENRLGTLETLGFKLSLFGTTTFRIEAVPALISQLNPIDLMSHILNVLDQANVEDRIIQLVCEFAAVKSGQVLNQDAMQSIIRQLERCQSPQIAPDGKPTLIHMSGEQLAREFNKR